ncbi:MAG: phosphoribosylglycinamide formyltransferase, partial [Bacteroidetes bacterium]|nr:phosphoribosylglycinamide formyltransferase [Bacteroidota bacterium]
VIMSGDKISGATVHLVDEEYDHGQILLQETVPVTESDTAETLAEKVLIVEHKIFPLAIKLLAEGEIEIKDDGVVIDE